MKFEPVEKTCVEQSRALALGLFHFNVNYIAGDKRAAHRYCAQAVLPFLDTLIEHPELRLTFETAAWGLEFLNEHYPRSVDLLRSLVGCGRLELLCSGYGPTIWPAFPGRDLRKSIELAREVLHELNLDAAPIFFSQEAFFGPGLVEIHDLFPILVCKDDYLRYVSGKAVTAPAFRMRDSLVLVGANHLGNEAARRHSAGKLTYEKTSMFHRSRIANSVNLIASSAPESITGSFNGVEWYWYHLGSGHHFCTSAQPADDQLFFYDPGWTRLNINLLHGLQAEGYKLSFLSEFAALLSDQDLPELPQIWEGSWNPTKSSGMSCWMGRHLRDWQDTSGVLSKAWRSRTALLSFEENEQCIPHKLVAFSETTQNKMLWKQQILAESSDPLGWDPTELEVQFGLDASEVLLQSIAAVSCESLRSVPDVFHIVEDNFAHAGIADSQDNQTVSRPLGESTKLVITEIVVGIHMCEVWFRHRTGRSGVRFENIGPAVWYTPSGLEGTTAALRLSELPEPVVVLPLANGFISLDEGRHLIRINCFGQVAARVLRDEKALEFLVEGPGRSKQHHWQILLITAPLPIALQLAERLNHV